MLVTRRGIICKSIKYGETSLIVDIFSRDIGMRSYIISSVRSKNAKIKAATLQVMNLVDFVAYDKNDGRKNLLRIKEVKFDKVYSSIPFDIVKSSIGIFLIEICRKAIRTSDHNESLYDYIHDGFMSLDKMDSGLAHFHIMFLIGFASELGFELTPNQSIDKPYFNLNEGIFVSAFSDHRYTVDKETSTYLGRYLSSSDVIKVPKEYRKEVLKRLIDFYRYHIEDFGELKSLEVLYSLYA